MKTMYEFYLDKILLPVNPKKISMKIKNQNKTVSLLNDYEMSILKPAGLTEITFDCLLPNMQYPFARYLNGFQNAFYYLEHLKGLKNSQKPFQLIVNRTLPNGFPLYATNLQVSLEDYTETEEAAEGFDITVSIKLKKYVEFKTKKVELKSGADGTELKEEAQRETSNAPSASEYIVKKGDCLWNIARYFYQDGSSWRKIYEANKSQIKNPNLIYPGQVLSIPAKEG